MSLAADRRAASDAGGSANVTFSTFLQLEEAARRAPTVEALRFSIVNELRRLIEYRQAVLFVGSPGAGRLRVDAISGVAVLDRDVPMIRWLDRAGNAIGAADTAGAGGPAGTAPQVVDRAGLDDRISREWAEWSPPQVLWCPLADRDDRVLGALWLARERPWQTSETVMIARLAGCWAHAWLALTGGRRPVRPGRRTGRAIAAGAVIAGLACLAIPVPQSALAPAAVVAAEPSAVAAPFDGVVARFLVAPNEAVETGQPLLRFDDTALESQVSVAERTLAIAAAELHRARQGAMIDREQAGRVALLEGQMRLRSAELDYVRSLLARVTVTAERAGIAVFTDPNDWVGRPVVTGQRILSIADPERVEMRIELPVRDGIALAPGSPVELFLDVDPLAPLPGTVTSASYEAETTPAGVLAYRVVARFPKDLAPPRIGLQGTAKIYGTDVPLALYLFRRPLVALRQKVGL